MRENKLSESEVRLLRILVNYPTITQEAMAEEMDISIKAVRHVLSKLKSKGLVIREGARKNGKWIVQNVDLRTQNEE